MLQLRVAAWTMRLQRSFRETDMPTVYVNGQYVEGRSASVSVFDRGFLFGDAVYEATCVFDGRLVDFGSHFRRLKRSLDAVMMRLPMGMDEARTVHQELLRHNGLTYGFVYFQVTRGAPVTRDFLFPDPDEVPQTVVAFTGEWPSLDDDPKAKTGIRIATAEDRRWRLRNVKSVQLLYSSMAKTVAVQSGADDVWLVDDGHVTEGSSHNAFIVKGGKIITRAISESILPGTMRSAVLRIAGRTQLSVEERRFTVKEAQDADEAFITSSCQFVTPVIAIDGIELSDGAPGAVSRQLRNLYLEMLTSRSGAE